MTDTSARRESGHKAGRAAHLAPLLGALGRLGAGRGSAFRTGDLDVFFVGRTIINQAGRAIPVFAMVMAVYLALSLLTSFVLNWYNRRIQFIER